MRVISGSAKGRKLMSVPGSGTRPITDRVKGALFDILGIDIEGATFLDLFAGTGSVGIEALSRGASQVVFVERARKAIATVQRNLEITGLTERAEIVREDAFHFIQRASPGRAYDYIYVAPPQYRGLWAKVLLLLNAKPLLASDGLVIVQMHPKEYRDISTPNLDPVRERQYGSTVLRFYAPGKAGSARHEEEDHGAD